MTGNRLLFPDHETIEKAEHLLTMKLVRARRRQSKRRVTPGEPSKDWREALATFTFDKSNTLDAVTDWTLNALEDGIVQMTHPGCLGLFNPSPTFPAECADRIAGAFNPQICVWSHAPKAVEIEQHVIRQLATRAGFADGASGHFTSGGAEANAAAVLCALNSKNPAFSDIGARAFGGQPTLYA